MKKNLLLSLSFAVLLFLWLISGCFVHDDGSLDQPVAREESLLHVRVMELYPEEIEEELVVSGTLEPARRVVLRSEVNARVLGLGVERGRSVKEGDVLVELDPRDLPQRLKEVQAVARQRELEYEAARQLLSKKLRSEANVAEALAAYENALAQVELVSIDLNNTVIRAPFSGKVQSRDVEVGSYLKKGDSVVTVVEVDPFILVSDVSEQFVTKLRAGMSATAEPSSGAKVEGIIRYIAPESDASTRTFRVEALAQNAGDLNIGQTAKITFPIRSLMAHKVSASVLSINTIGDIGVKVADEEDRVRFYPADIVKSDRQSIWLGGLPEKARIITVGQGFALEGERVKVVLVN